MDDEEAIEAVRTFTGRIATLSGPRHSGKTSALLARAVALAESGVPVVAVCCTAASARSFGDAVLDRSPEASGLIRPTTWGGLAMDIRDRAGRPARRLIGLGTHRRRIGELLSAEKSLVREWPTLAPTLSSAIRQREIADAVLELQRSWLGHDEIVTHATAAGCGDRWGELARFTERYTAWLDSRGEIDPARLLVDAGLALRIEGGAAAYRAHCPHLVVDDFERADFAVNRLLTMLVGPAPAVVGSAPAVLGSGRAVVGSVVVAGDPHGARWRRADAASPFTTIGRRLATDAAFVLRAPPTPEPAPGPTPTCGPAPAPANDTTPGPAPSPAIDTTPGPQPTWRAARRVLANAHHRSLEADAVVGAVVDAHEAGTAWDDIAVVLPPVGQNQLVSSLRRVARRLGVPLSVPLLAGDDPIVQAFADVVAWTSDRDVSRLSSARAVGMVNGADDRRLADIPGNLAAGPAVHATWNALAPWFIAHAKADSLDLVTAFVQRAGSPGADIADGLEARVTPVGGEVAVVAPNDIAGRTWSTVIVTRCLDGVWPTRGRFEQFFDTALLDGPDVADGPERGRREAAEWARRFEEVIAAATDLVVGVGAPEPGVLLSRFVEDWDRTAVGMRRPSPTPRAIVAPALSPGVAPAFPSRRLRLSATQLDTYENCPLNYQFQYVAGIRGEGSVSASVGTMVHAALETFLLGDDRSEEALMASLEAKWDSGAFDYRPQEADYHMRADGWLRRWWVDELPRIAEVIAVEHRFTIDVGAHELTGSIDRVSRDTDGQLEIVDYKTGAAPGGRIDEDNLQLATYHLAATRDPVIAAHGAPDRLRLHYLDSGSGSLPHSGKDIDQPITPDHVERTEARILLTADAIIDERFEPSVEANCDYCSFHRLCPLQPEGREVRLP